jgi:hypothetical protein
MAATESSQTYTQTCVMYMKELGGYCRNRIPSDIHSALCYGYERVGRIWPEQNPIRHTLSLVLCI